VQTVKNGCATFGVYSKKCEEYLRVITIAGMLACEGLVSFQKSRKKINLKERNFKGTGPGDDWNKVVYVKV
jgi:hypothetical protein